MMFQMSKGEHEVLIMTWKMICQTLQAKKGRATRIKQWPFLNKNIDILMLSHI